MKLITGTFNMAETSVNESEQVCVVPDDYIEAVVNVIDTYPPR